MRSFRIPGAALGLVLAATAALAADSPGSTRAEELALGTEAPDFSLLGTDGAEHTLASIAGGGETAARATVVVFTCNACPVAKAYEPVLLDLAERFQERRVAFVFVNPNDPKVQPEDSYEKMQARAKEQAYPFPYVFDATQQTAHAYGAAVTPHVFLLDAGRVLRYRGRVNDHRDPAKVQSNDLADAIEAVLAGDEVAKPATKAFGCSIKWRKAS